MIPRWVEVREPIYGITAPRYELTQADGGKLRVIIVPNDIGVVDFEDACVEKTERGVTLHRAEGDMRFARQGGGSSSGFGAMNRPCLLSSSQVRSGIRSVQGRVIIPKFRKVQPRASPDLSLAARWTCSATPRRGPARKLGQRPLLLTGSKSRVDEGLAQPDRCE